MMLSHYQHVTILVLIVYANAFIRWRHKRFMYQKEQCSFTHEQCSFTHENIPTSFTSEFNLYVNYLPTGVASGVDVVVKFSKMEEK